MNIPKGYCQCGCGEKTNISPQNYAKLGYKRGEPMKYIIGHSNRKSPYQYIENKKTGCWEWQRGCNKVGYALLYIKRETRLAHRVFYEKHKGKIPQGKYVLHSCDNPSCVNPKHLFIGTAKENMQDAKRKERLKGMKNASGKYINHNQ